MKSTRLVNECQYYWVCDMLGSKRDDWGTSRHAHRHMSVFTIYIWPCTVKIWVSGLTAHKNKAHKNKQSYTCFTIHMHIENMSCKLFVSPLLTSFNWFQRVQFAHSVHAKTYCIELKLCFWGVKCPSIRLAII